MNFVTKLNCTISPFHALVFRSQSRFEISSTISFFNKRNKYFALLREGFDLIQTRGLSNLVKADEKFIQPKKRVIKKKKCLTDRDNGFYVEAYSTAEEYNLESLLETLLHQTPYKSSNFNTEYGKIVNCLHTEAFSEGDLEARHIFFFREGSVVMWNVPHSESKEILSFLKQHEAGSFNENLIKNEQEIMNYSYSPDIICLLNFRNKSKIVNDNLIFSSNKDLKLEKYAVSNAMALSVRLGCYEANLDAYIESMEPVIEDLKAGFKVKISKDEVLRKTGQIFSLRHNINLSSDLLDTPDFYWDREELESLYQETFKCFYINKRTRVVNEKINHCIELVQLLSSHLSDKHHVRLEWMIIVLIMVEVAFEFLHYFEKTLETSGHHSSINSVN